MDIKTLEKLSRRELQNLAKEKNIKANAPSIQLIASLSSLTESANDKKRKNTGESEEVCSTAKKTKGKHGGTEEEEEEEEEEEQGSPNPFQEAWDEVIETIARGVELEVWTAPTLNPPATTEEIATLEAEFKFHIGGYADLLLLANGMSWYSGGIGIVFGGTGDAEDDLRHAFNYSDDYGRKLFRRKKQVPLVMIDYDMCVEVYETKTGRVMQDDRECESYHHVASDLSAWLRLQVKALNEAIVKKSQA